MKTFCVLFCLLLFAAQANAANWYASATGSSTNGSRSLPWGPQYATTNTNPYLSAGDTVLFLPGIYTCVETNGTYSQILEFRKSGTPSSKITYRPEFLWGFKFNGALYIPEGTSNLIIKYCHLMSSNITARVQTNSTDLPNGITDFGHGNELLHNLIENTGHPGIGSWNTTRGKYIAGNVIRFIGADDWSPEYLGANRGSGMYLQNQDNSEEALIQGNISYHNYTTGMKAYGNLHIWKFTFRNNTATENAEAGIFYHQDNYGNSNLTVNANYGWRNGSGIVLGYSLGNGGHSNAVVTENYIVDSGYGLHPFWQVDGWSGNTWSNNVGVALADRYPWMFEVAGETSGDVASHHIDFNTYYATNFGGFGAAPFFVNETNKLTFEQWQATIHGDTNSAFIYATPASNSVFVIQPSTDSAFVHVTSFNWTNAATATVNLGSYFRPGERVAVFDSQNIPTAYNTVESFSGSTLELDLALTNRATMVGIFTQRTDTWDGFDPRFRAFVIYAVPVVVAHTANANVGQIVMAQQ